ncbi:MAG TPA: protein kinase [Sandaracinaceae bacterium LLY-WYZ-13_1]|nr:protein kinase [Sandaracinaceae bacterium LLY-WYZ-13_1]
MDSELAPTLPGSPIGPVLVCTLPRAGDLFGHYRVERALGDGGMGVVFRARDEILDRPVALKLIRPSLMHDPAVRRAFHEESRAMAALAHPNVVRIYDRGEVGGVGFIVMELFAGGSLLETLAGGARMDLAEALPVLRDVARGLTAVHERGLVHGDVKPANVLLGAVGGRAAVTDMGLSFRQGDDDGRLRGTPGYVAPERIAGVISPASLQPRIDVYGLAVTAWEMLAGRRLREAARSDEPPGAHTRSEEPPSLRSMRPSLPAGVDEVLRRGMHPDPRERTATPLALVEALESVARGAARPSVRFLLVDDDGGYRSALSRVLARRFPGATIEGFADGLSGLSCARADAPDVALVDLCMPGLDGRAVTAALRALAPPERLRIVVLSGEGGAREWRELRGLGADRFYVKPVPLDELCDSLERLLAPAPVDAAA